MARKDLWKIVVGLLLVMQAVATIWFWWSNITDQLLVVARQNGPTAIWLSSTVLFLTITAGFQWIALRQKSHPKRSWQFWEAHISFLIMLASAVGGAACLLIYLARRAGWTSGDTICLAVILVLQLVILRTSRPNSKMTGLAISLRSVPRLFYSLGFFTAAFVSMSSHTIASGEAIATLRLLAGVQSRVAHSNLASQHLFRTELIGNFGSQTFMLICWLVATHHL